MEAATQSVPADPTSLLEESARLDSASVPAGLVHWANGALAARDPDVEVELARSCEEAVAATTEKRPVGPVEENLKWQAELVAATERLDIECMASLHSAASRVAVARSDYQGALAHLTQARYLAARSGDVEGWALYHLNSGTVLFFLGRFDQVLTAVTESLPWIERQGDAPYPLWQRAAAHLIEGRTLLALGRTVEAIEALQDSLDLYEYLENRWPSDRGSRLPPTLLALGRANLESGNAPGAEHFLRRVLELDSESAHLRASTLVEIAEVNARFGDPGGALELLAEARDLAGDLETHDIQLVLQLDYVEALAREALGERSRAIEAAQDLLATLEAHRALDATELTMPFFVRRNYYADLLLRLLLDADRIGEAFEVTEHLRARGLLDAIFWPATRLRELASSEDIANADRLRAEYADLLRRHAGDSAADAKIFATREALILLESGIRRRVGAMAAEPITLAEMRGLLRPGDLLLSLWPHDEQVELFVLEGPSGTPRVIELGSLERIAAVTAQILRSMDIERSRSRGVERELEALGLLVLDPVREELARSSHVIVAAEGILGSIPFATLPRHDGQPLVRSHSTMLVQSLSVLAAIRARSRDRRALELAAIADPAYLDGSVRPSLPALARGAHEIAGLVDPGLESTRILEGLEATRSRVLDGALAASRFVHIGAHIDLHAAVPDLSAIRLAEPGLDGALRLRDLTLLELDADLVTLAGCRGAGELRRGAEGPMAFPRGFLHAGADAVVASLWQVREQPTADLMTEIYRQLVDQGAAPSEALRRAQLHLLDGDWPSPSHWAGFVILGDGASGRRIDEPSVLDEPSVATRVHLGEGAGEGIEPTPATTDDTTTKETP